MEPATLSTDSEPRLKAEDVETMHVEKDVKETDVGSFDDDTEPIDEAMLKRAKRKIDMRLIPILGCLYIWCLIDRTNLGGARIAGIDAAIGLDVGNRASVSILVFYIGYIIFELPSNIMLQKVGPANWLGGLCISWGIVTLCVGFIKDWRALAGLRALLGILEGGMFPGSVYLISSWYCRYEYQKRVAIFYIIGFFFSSFANILAYGLTQIASNPEVNGWKWIFIVEGAITIGYGVLCWFAIPAMPYDEKRNKWLSPAEKALIKRRLLADTGSFEGEKVTWKAIWTLVKKPYMWAFGMIAMTGAAGTYSFLLFLPVILRRGLGFSLQHSFLLASPPAAFSALYSISVSVVSDRWKVRGPFVLVHGVITLIGLCMIGFLKQPAARYSGTFLGQAGVNALLASVNAWGFNNVRGDAQRSIYSAWATIMSSIGGIYSALVFRQQDSPNYLPGVIATGALVIASIVVTGLTIPYFIWANRQADQGKRVIEGLPGFRYTI